MGLFLTATQVGKLASILLKDYKKLADQGILDPDLLPPNATKIAAALEVLVNGNFLNAAPDAASITPLLLKTAIAAFQKKLGPGLVQDGILGERTLNALHRLGACRGHMQHTPSTTPVVSPETPDLRTIRWWFDPGALPTLTDGDAEISLRKSWVSWILVAELNCQKALSRNGANVIVMQADIDSRSGGVLADAHVGPPNGMVFQLRFDKAESPWTARKFEATAKHEIGHLLGLQHTLTPGSIMAATYQDDVTEPTNVDKLALAQLGWAVR